MKANQNRPKTAAHKKDDDRCDEESKGNFVKKTLEKENSHKIDQLLNNVSTLKQISNGLGGHLKDEKVLLEQIDNNFAKSTEMVRRVMGRMDDMLQRASGSIVCYIVLFTCLMIGILIKLT